MSVCLTRDDRLGLLRPALDAHTLGVSSIGQLLLDCGHQCVIANAEICKAAEDPANPRSVAILEQWIRRERLTALGLSYRLDPHQGAELFGLFVYKLKARSLLASQGGPLKALYFAGLPKACELVAGRVAEVTATFDGDETAFETLAKLGIDSRLIPGELAKGIAYDEDRLAFGEEIVRKGEYLTVAPVNPRNYREFGTRQDTLVSRIQDSVRTGSGPVMRAHVGPYLENRSEAIKLFGQWAKQLAAGGLLDVLSIGTSQLSQSHFGQDWNGMPNGGGVPVNSPEEFAAIYEAARPMLVRTYAGTQDVPALAKMYEQTLNIAWHALSLWWFCRIDGRGPNPVLENLKQHVETLRYIASTAKPFEANVSHHFAFRGADDVTYIVSAVLAARLAKHMGIRHFVLQNMLNTPKATWGIADLAKSRAMLTLVREFQSPDFQVIFQPRAGLDYFVSDQQKAKAQLAAASALMDDIEPDDATSPEVIHVVSYCEASHLADPSAVNESIQITRHAIDRYRVLRRNGSIDNMSHHAEVNQRTAHLLAEARVVLAAIDKSVPQPCTAEGLYRIFADGFLPVPYLWECRDEFRHAVGWQTRLVRGAMEVVDEQGLPVSAQDRMRQVFSPEGDRS